MKAASLNALAGGQAPPLEICAHEAHVWCAPLMQPDAVLQKMKAMLSADEFARAARFQFEKHRNRFVIGRGLLREVLSRYLDMPAHQIALEYETHGKPRLAEALNSKKIFFNLSHAEDLWVCAFTRGREVGVDVEHVQVIAEAENLAQRFFAKAEAESFCALPAHEKQRAFFHCWTRKEAFIKALGEGLSHPLHRFEVSFLPGAPAALLRTAPDPREAERWSMFAFEPAREYVAALVVAGKSIEVKFWEWQGFARA